MFFSLDVLFFLWVFHCGGLHAPNAIRERGMERERERGEREREMRGGGGGGEDQYAKGTSVVVVLFCFLLQKQLT